MYYSRKLRTDGIRVQLHMFTAALYENPTYSPGTIERLLRASATDLGASGYDEYYGAGLVNLRPFVVKSNRFEGHTYRLYQTKINWNEAKEKCESLGGHMVTITSAEEQNAIEELLKKYAKINQNYWIGLTDSESEGDWSKWITGEDVIFKRWGDDQPDDDYTGGQNYGVIVTGNLYSNTQFIFGDWDDISEDQINNLIDGYICEWDN